MFEIARASSDVTRRTSYRQLPLGNAEPEVSRYTHDRADTHKCDQREAGGAIGTMIGEVGSDCLMFSV